MIAIVVRKGYSNFYGRCNSTALLLSNCEASRSWMTDVPRKIAKQKPLDGS